MEYQIGDLVVVDNKELVITQDPEGLDEYFENGEVEENEYGVLPSDHHNIRKGFVRDIISSEEIDKQIDSNMI